MLISVTLIWIILALILALIVASIFELYRIKKSQSDQNNQNNKANNSEIEGFLSSIQNVEDFGPVEPTNDDRGNCNIYTFPGGPGSNDPAKPNYSVEELDKLTPEAIKEGSCIDPDQIAAQKGSRLCNKDGGCTNPDGTITSKGAQTVNYFPCFADVCKSSLSLISIPYSPDDPSISLCLKFSENIFINTGCSLQDEAQLFQITRVNPETFTENPNGPYGKIIYRSTGECLAPQNTNEFGSGDLILTKCENLPNGGIIWFFSPPFQINGVNTPQQIVYSGNQKDAITVSQFSSIAQEGKIQSISISQFTPPFFNGKAVLDTFSIESNTGQEGGIRNTQLVDYTLFNVILNAPFKMGNFPFPIWNWTV